MPGTPGGGPIDGLTRPSGFMDDARARSRTWRSQLLDDARYTRFNGPMSGPDEHLTQLRKGSLQLAVLALLASQPRYGFDIVEALAVHPGLDVNAGTVYPLLTRLKNAALVETTWQESPVGPPRKYYRLSAEGERTLAAQRSAWRQLSTTMNNLLQEHQGVPQ